MLVRIGIFFVFAMVAANAEVYRIQIDRADGKRERVTLDFAASHVYIEVPLQDKRRYDYGECHVKEGATCTLRYSSKIYFHKVEAKGR